MPILHDFECIACGFLFEYLIFKQEEIEKLLCPECGNTVVRIISSPNIANYNSGFKKTPLLEDTGKELDTKKKDIFGRKFDELPDDLNKERMYHEKIEEKEKSTGKKVTTDEQIDTIKDVFGKDKIKRKD